MLQQYLSSYTNSISKRLIAQIVFVSSIITLIITIAQVIRTYSRENKKLQGAFEIVEKNYLKQINFAISEFNEPSLKMLMVGISQLPGIVNTNIVIEGNLFHLIENEGDFHKVNMKSRRWWLKDGLNESAQDSLDANPMSTYIEITIDNTVIKKEIMYNVIFLISLNFVKTFIIIVFMQKIFTTVLFSRLFTIINNMKCFNLEDDSHENQAVSHCYKDEIFQLDNSFQEMIKLIISSHKEIQNLTYSLIRSQELERERISRELHDGIGQLVVSAKLNIKNGEVAKSISLLDTIIEDLRAIYNGLFPSIVINYTLEEGIEWFINHLNLPLHIKMDINLKKLSTFKIKNDDKIHIFRLFQEIISNSVKHSGASHIYMDFKPINNNQDGLFIIGDNGKGHDFKSKKGHFGLSNIKYRVKMIGGILNYYGLPGEATVYKITIKQDRT